VMPPELPWHRCLSSARLASTSDETEAKIAWIERSLAMRNRCDDSLVRHVVLLLERRYVRSRLRPLFVPVGTAARVSSQMCFQCRFAVPPKPRPEAALKRYSTQKLPQLLSTTM
jgi:hypothetical protein